MTKKQYELIPNWCIYENIDGVEKWLKLDEVCNLLNELYEENQKLKKENAELEKFRYSIFKRMGELYEEQ